MNVSTEIETVESDLPLSLQVERDYVQTIGLMVAVDAKVPGIFGDMTERRRDYEQTSRRLEEAGVELRAFTESELLDRFAMIIGLAMSSGDWAAVLERDYKGTKELSNG